MLAGLVWSPPSAADPSRPDTLLTAARRAAVADSVAALLAARYPDAAQGRRLADSLRA